jgi:hypothetical protein
MSKPSAPPPPDPTVVAGAQTQLNSDTARQMARLNRSQQNSPFGNTRWTVDSTGDNWTQDTTVDPRISDAFFRSLKEQGDKSGLASLAGGQAGAQLSRGEFDPKLIPSGVDRVDPSQLVGDVDLGGINALPGTNDFGGERQKVEDALYGRATSKLDPQYKQRQAELESTLTGQGFARGSEAWNKEMDNLARQRTEDYSTARNDAVAKGGEEQSRLFGEALAARGQGVGERFQKAGFYNDAASKDFANLMQSGQFQNAARGQRFGEELTKRREPFDEYAQLVHGSTPSQPGAGTTGGPGGINVAPADFTSAALGQYNGQMSQYGTQMGNYNATTGATAAIIAAAIAAMASDENIKDKHGEVDNDETLDKLKELRVDHWNYKDDPEKKIHMGTYAQDWAEQFGGDGKTIPVIDAFGTLLSSVRALSDRVDKLSRKGAHA